MKLTPAHLAVYAITDRQWLQGQTLDQAVEAAIRGGATCIQLREKHLLDDDKAALARKVQSVCRAFHVPFIINDDVILAKNCGADGVHLGQGDLNLAEARRFLGPDVIIGVTAKTLHQALEAQRHGASYLGSGAVFPTSSKADATPLEHSTLKAICANVNIPVVAIGGITTDNLSQLAGLGVAGIAGISMFFAHPNVETATRKVAAAVREMLQQPASAVKAALFDLDGTLLDTLDTWFQLVDDFLARHHLTPPDDLLQQLTGIELWEAANIFHDTLIPQLTPQAILQEWIDYLHDTYFQRAPLLPNAKQLVQQALDDGFIPAITTSTDRDCAIAALERTGLLPYFQHRIFTAAELHLPKREPDFYWSVIGKLGATIQNSRLYDDSQHCLVAARAAGLQVIDAKRCHQA